MDQRTAHSSVLGYNGSADGPMRTSPPPRTSPAARVRRRSHDESGSGVQPARSPGTLRGLCKRIGVEIHRCGVGSPVVLVDQRATAFCHAGQGVSCPATTASTPIGGKGSQAGLNCSQKKGAYGKAKL